MRPRYVDVIPCVRLPRTLHTFTYSVPEELVGVAKGDLVQMPFRGRTVSGIVSDHRSRKPVTAASIVPIASIHPVRPYLPLSQLTTLQQTALHALVAPATIAQALVPLPPLRKVNKQPTTASRAAESASSFRTAPSVIEETKSQIAALHEDGTPQIVVLPHRNQRMVFALLFAHRTLREKKSLLIIAPERRRAIDIAAVLRGRFGTQVSAYHSALNKNEKFDVWRSVQQGRISVLVTTRAGMLAPFLRLSTILVDEEESESHKQWDQNPRYDTIQVTELLAKVAGAQLIRTTITPRVATLHQHRNRNARILKPPVRERASIGVSVQDMSKEPPRTQVGQLLSQAIERSLAQRAPVVLLLNRRVRAAPIQFSEVRRSVTDTLLEKPSGTTLATVASDIRSLWPTATVHTVDIDHQLRLDALRGKHIILGTEWMLSQRPPKTVTTCGILKAETLLGVSTYRARERALQLINRFRAWGSPTDSCIVQTHDMSDPLFAAVKKNDWGGLFSEELRDRKRFNYPPYRTLILLLPIRQLPKKTRRHSLDELIGMVTPHLPKNAHIERVGFRHERYPEVRETAVIRLSPRSYTQRLQKILRDALPADWMADVDPLEW